MLEAIENSEKKDAPVSNISLLHKELEISSKHSAKLLQVHLDTSRSSRNAAMRQQLKSMLMHAERSLANEETSRALSRLFGKFTLLQKIMQTMG